MRIQLLTLLALGLIHQIKAQTLVLSNQNCQIRAIASSDTLLSIHTKCDLYPGAVLKFDSAFFLIFQRLNDTVYAARYYNSVRSTKTKKTIVNAGQVIHHRNTIRPLKENTQYWSEIENRYLSSLQAGDGNWLCLANSLSQVESKLQVGQPLMLSIKNPPIEGYLCLLAIEEDRCIVLFPNTKPGTINGRKVALRGNINLTYHRQTEGLIPAFTNIFLKTTQVSKLTFVAIISKFPQTLSAFLPKKHNMEYQTLEGQKVMPWEIGPGIFKLQAPFLPSKGIEYLPGDSWAIASLTLSINN